MPPDVDVFGERSAEVWPGLVNVEVCFGVDVVFEEHSPVWCPLHCDHLPLQQGCLHTIPSGCEQGLSL